jgi:tetratricopeptide (TPR) repeat protein
MASQAIEQLGPQFVLEFAHLFDAAIEQYQKARMMNPDSTFALSGLGMSYARSGNQGEARKALEEMEGMAKRSYVSPVYTGLIYQALAKRDLAFEWYAKGYDDRGELLLLWLTFDPLFDDVRGDPRFADLVRRVGVATPAP